MTNTRFLRASGFHIFPVGHKVCFTDNRTGYTSPSYDPDTCMLKLMEYIGVHRLGIDQMTEQQRTVQS